MLVSMDRRFVTKISLLSNHSKNANILNFPLQSARSLLFIWVLGILQKPDSNFQNQS